ncbi:helix-turn-helix domain-containing protein [Micromonospora sp. NPDC049679]|uniref:helix-turn-helix domain-containing protein n=1 Tax=Micromonospora sp. NPDC049679 TaxID=3155920 RepID=UPI0033D132AC
MATPKDLPRDVGGFIRDLRRNAKISLRQLADQAGVSNPYLSQIERGLRKPSAEVLQQLASALRVSTPVMYLRAGLLDDNNGQGVLAAIAADADLTMSQKQSLSQIYETFRRENARLAEAAAAAPVAEPDPSAGDTAASAPAATETVVVAEQQPAASPIESVLESVAVTEAGATPAPATTPKPVKRVARKATRVRPEMTDPNSATAPAAEEEK